jgi:hypothetical protein
MDRAKGHRHLATLRDGGRGLRAIRQMLHRVVAEARAPCLWGAVCDFGTRNTE